MEVEQDIINQAATSRPTAGTISTQSKSHNNMKPSTFTTPSSATTSASEESSLEVEYQRLNSLPLQVRSRTL